MLLKITNLFFLTLLAAGYLLADQNAFEQYVISLESLPGLEEKTRLEHLNRLKELDPAREYTNAMLERLFSGSSAGLEDLCARLNNADYYTRITAARLILTYSVDDIREYAEKTEHSEAEPEVMFQMARILDEINNNYYAYRENIDTVKMNLLLYLSSEADRRFLEFAPRAYSEGDEQKRESLLSMISSYSPEERLPFLGRIFSETKGRLRYDLFRLIRSQSGNQGVKDLVSGIITDRTLPVMLRTQAASVYRRMRLPRDSSFQRSIDDPFIGGIIRGEISISQPVVPGKIKPPGGYGTIRMDSFISAGAASQLPGASDLYVHAVTSDGDIWCHSSQTGVVSVPVSDVSKIYFTPTGKRLNDDFSARVILKNSDSVSGVVTFPSEGRCVVESTYINKKLEMDLSDISLIQFNTERKKPVPPQYIEDGSPEIRLSGGDVITGILTESRKGRIEVRLKGIRVFAGSSGKPVESLQFETRDIQDICFPGKPEPPLRGSCHVITMFDDRISGNLLEVTPESVRLFSGDFGMLTLDKEKVQAVELNNGYSEFSEMIVAVFGSLGKVQIYNIHGQVMWERGGFRRPVYAEQTSSGDIIVCERETGSVLVFSRDQILLHSYQGYTNVSRAHALANGHILICSDSNTNSLVEVEKSGKTVKSYPGVRYVSDAAVALDGKLLIASARSNRIYTVDENGSAVPVITVTYPRTVQILSTGNFLVTGREGITEFSTDYKKVNTITKFDAPLAFYSGGVLYVGENTSFYKLDSQGEVIMRLNLPMQPDSISMY